jgi:hypothetical protein
MRSPNIPGADAVEWFDRLPTFHGAEVLSFHLNRRGRSILRIHAWAAVASVPGLPATDRDAIVVFEFEGIRRLRLEGEQPGGRTIIDALKLRLTDEGYRLELYPTLGIGGEIVAEAMAVRIEDGR